MEDVLLRYPLVLWWLIFAVCRVVGLLCYALPALLRSSNVVTLCSPVVSCRDCLAMSGLDGRNVAVVRMPDTCVHAPVSA